MLTKMLLHESVLQNITFSRIQKRISHKHKIRSRSWLYFARAPNWLPSWIWIQTKNCLRSVVSFHIFSFPLYTYSWKSGYFHFARTRTNSLEKKQKKQNISIFHLWPPKKLLSFDLSHSRQLLSLSSLYLADHLYALIDQFSFLIHIKF